MEENNQVDAIIALLKEFNQQSEDLFLKIADHLPVLLGQLSQDLLPYTNSTEELVALEQEMSNARSFVEQINQEDNNLFDKTYKHFNLTPLAYSGQDKVANKERLLNGLLRKAPCYFVELFTYQEVLTSKINKALATMKQQLLPSLQEFNQEKKAVSTFLSDSKALILQAMEEIQKQDIMRQSINHAVMSLEEFQLDLGDDLENISFRLDLLELSLAVINEVKDMLQGINELFGGKLKTINNQIASIGARKKAMTKQLTTAGGVLALINLAGQTIRSSKIAYSRYLSLKEKTIKAHYLVLKQALQSMEQLLNEGVQESELVFIKQVVDAEVPLVYDATTAALAREKDYRLVSHSLAAVVEKTGAAYHHMQEMVLDESAHQQVQAALAEIVDNVYGIEGLVALLNQSKELVIEQCRLTINKKYELLQEKGLSSYKLKSNKISELTAKFTIFSHKKAAGVIAGFDVEEERADDGEFILF